jgi:hypothetical protein
VALALPAGPEDERDGWTRWTDRVAIAVLALIVAAFVVGGLLRLLGLI